MLGEHIHRTLLQTRFPDLSDPLFHSHHILPHCVGCAYTHIPSVYRNYVYVNENTYVPTYSHPLLGVTYNVLILFIVT